MANKLEERLYSSASTKEEYLDMSSLKRRLHLVAKGVDVPQLSAERVAPLLPNQGSQTSQNNSNNVPRNHNNQPCRSSIEGSGSMVLNPQQTDTQMLLQATPNQLNPNSIKRPEGITNTQSEKRKQLALQQRRLILLRHSKLCKLPNCNTKFCSQLKTHWAHIQQCTALDCQVQHCLSSRSVLSHQYYCKRKATSDSCQICVPVKQFYRKLGDDDDGDNWNDDWNNFSLFETERRDRASSTNLTPLPPNDTTGNQALIEDIQTKQAVITQICSQKVR